MNKEALMVMQRLYAGSREPVLILDENWKVLWSSDGTRSENLPVMLGIPRGSWENVTRPLVSGEKLYTCRLSCSAQDGLRIAELTPSAQPMDLGQLTGHLQSMLTVCTALDADLDSMGIYDERDRLNALARNILRMYRAVFLRREIERGMDGAWGDEVFCLQTALSDSFGKLPGLLRDCAEISIEPGAGNQFVKGDVKGFECAALAGMLLCITAPEKMQRITIKACAKKEKAILEISVLPLEEERGDVREQGISGPCGTAADRELLELYCGTFGIELFFAAGSGAASCRMEIPAITETKGISLGAPCPGGADGFFDLVPVMMARFRARKRF